MDHPLEPRTRGRHVVLRVVIQRKDVSNPDGIGGGRSRIELKSIVSALSGREFAEFGTVRPRVQIPGPRPKIVFKSRSSPAPSGATGLQGGHRFSWNEVTTAPSKWISNRRLNSLTVIAEPIYQHAHGLRTVRHPGSEFQGRSGWSLTAATRHEVEQTSLNHLRCVWLYPYARRQLHQRLRSPDLCLSVRGVTSSRTPSRARSMKPVKTSPVSGPPGKSTRR